VLVVGPSGCGRSRFINLLFNKIVAESKASAAFVTRQIKPYSGTGSINLCQRKVNLIDTIGLCDSFISEDIVLKLIQESLRINFAYLDQVVVICSGRIEFRHAENIRPGVAKIPQV
jgi:septin family protein